MQRMASPRRIYPVVPDERLSEVGTAPGRQHRHMAGPYTKGSPSNSPRKGFSSVEDHHQRGVPNNFSRSQVRWSTRNTVHEYSPDIRASRYAADTNSPGYYSDQIRNILATSHVAMDNEKSLSNAYVLPRNGSGVSTDNNLYQGNLYYDYSGDSCA